MKWRWPSPFEVFGGLMVVAFAALQVPGLLPHGGRLEAICTFIMTAAGLSGIASAKKFLPDHVKEILEEHDEQVNDALEAAKTQPPPMPEDKP